MNTRFSISIEDNKNTADMSTQMEWRQYDKESVLRLL
jgi:hypothetical protein